jgi:hypothetical protein
MEAKLNEILSILRDHGKALDETKSLLAESLGKIAKLEEHVAVLQTQVTLQDKEIRILKDKVNAAEQSAKSSSIRLIGYPATDEETKTTDGGKAFASRLYDRVIKPILSVAKAKGDISTIPSAANCIDTVYRAGKLAPGARLPPLVITLNNKMVRLAILRHKKNNIPMPSEEEKAAGAKRFALVEDLTGASYRMLKMLQDDDRVAKAWSYDGQIRFTLKDNPNFVKKVPSVFLPLESFVG